LGNYGQEHDLVLAVDGGASKTEARLRRTDGTVLAAARTGPCNLFQNAEAAIAAIAEAWHICCAQAGLAPAATMARTVLSAGIAGIHAPGGREQCRAAFAGFAQVLLSSDGYTALVGAFGTAPGALLSIGTGVVGCRFDAQGRFALLGGWGFPVGDRGGGAWIGLRLVGGWLEHRDGIVRRDGSSALWQHLESALGATRAAILAELRGAPPSRYAALAPLLLDAAATGDPFASAVLDEAAGHLAALARALGSDTLALGGGLSAPLAPRLEAALAGGFIAIAHHIAPAALEGAWRVALGERPAEFV
jgi:glucosamine kinase